MKIPEFKSMFSNLPHHPRLTLRLRAADPVPAFIDRRWRGLAEQRKETLHTLGYTHTNTHTHTVLYLHPERKCTHCTYCTYGTRLFPVTLYLLSAIIKQEDTVSGLAQYCTNHDIFRKTSKQAPCFILQTQPYVTSFLYCMW